MSNEMLAAVLTFFVLLVVLALATVPSLGLGFLIAKALAMYACVEYSTVLWLGVSSVVFIVMSLAN